MARDFNGSSDISYTLNAGQTGFSTVSIGFWEWLDNNDQYRRPFHWDTGGAQDWRLEFDNGWGYALLVPWSTSDSGRSSWSIAKPSTGSWHHLLITYDGSSSSNDPIFYINGNVESSTERVAPSGTITAPSTALYVGSENGSGQFHDGRLAEFAIWNRVLTAGEASALGKGFSPLFSPNGLKFYSPLIGEKSTEPDLMFGTAGSVDAGVTKIAHPRIIYPSSSQMRGFKYSAGVATVVKDLIGGGFIPFAR